MECSLCTSLAQNTFCRNSKKKKTRETTQKHNQHFANHHTTTTNNNTNTNNKRRLAYLLLTPWPVARMSSTRESKQQQHAASGPEDVRKGGGGGGGAGGATHHHLGAPFSEQFRAVSKKNFTMVVRIKSIIVNDALWTLMLAAVLILLGVTVMTAETPANLVLNSSTTVDLEMTWPGEDACKDWCACACA